MHVNPVLVWVIRVWTFPLLSENIKIKIYEIIMLSVAVYECKSPQLFIEYIYLGPLAYAISLGEVGSPTPNSLALNN